MKLIINRLIITGALLLSPFSAFSAPTLKALDERITQLENSFKNANKIDLINKVESLEQELKEIRGLIETQEHDFKNLYKKQQECPSNASKNPKASPSTPHPGSQEAPLTQAPTNEDMSSSNIDKIIDESQHYQNAYGLVKTKNFDKAIQSFQDFLTVHPQGMYAANAHYWLGEIYMVNWQNNKDKTEWLDKAFQEFFIISKDFKGNGKEKDALLKMGLIEIEKGNLLKAQEYLMDVKTRFKGSSSASIAESKLKNLH
ncbi:MAG: uncharacterized protein JWM09_361 [Francisellaceae bacterium]|nr:uncharacterized protein [Francisellaceae bacterium]